MHFHKYTKSYNALNNLLQHIVDAVYRYRTECDNYKIVFELAQIFEGIQPIILYIYICT